jgi:predicted transcriptional regulator
VQEPGASFPRFRQNVLYPKDSARIREAVQRSPGSTLRALGLTLELHPVVVRGHVQLLARQGQVAQRRLGSRILVYPLQSAPKRGKRVVAAEVELRSEMQRRLLALIAEHPGLRQGEILEETSKWGWPRSTAQHRLGRLVEAGVVACKERRREKRYSSSAVTP